MEPSPPSPAVVRVGNVDFSFALSRFVRTESTEGWYFFNGSGESVGTLLVVQDRPDYWYIHASFVIDLDPAAFWPFLLDLLDTLAVHAGFVSVHAGGAAIITDNFDHNDDGVPTDENTGSEG